MRIQLINNSKLKIHFNLKDLEENNISLHSFLSGSKLSKKFFKALLEIAEEDFGIAFTNHDFNYETFCIDFSEFIILVTISDSMPLFKNQISDVRNNFIEANKQNCISFKFIDNKLFNYTDSIYYTFNNIENFLDFSNYSKIFLKTFNIETILYKYKNIFILEIKTNLLSVIELEKMISILSESKSIFKFSDLFLIHIKEFAEIFIPNNALNLK